MKKIYKFLIFSALAVVLGGCMKKEKEIVDWTIAGLPGYENDYSISKEHLSELNQLLEKKEKDYQVRFHFVTFREGELSEADEETLKNSDLITIKRQYSFSDDIKFYPTLTECAEKNLFEPLDQYMETENGKNIKQKMLSDLTLESGCWKDEQILLPTSLPLMTGPSLRIRKDLYEKLNMEQDCVPDFIKCDEFFAKIYEANDNMPFLVFSDRKSEGMTANNIPTELPQYLVDMFVAWGDSEENVLGSGSMKSTGSSIDTRNLLKEPYFAEYLDAWKRYTEKGYVNSSMNEKALVEIYESNKPLVLMENIEGEEWIVPKSENYTLLLRKFNTESVPFVGIGAGSKQKELAFEVLADMILDLELNTVFKNWGQGDFSAFVFHSDLSEEEEREYLRLLDEIPHFIQETTFDTFFIPEISELNRVYAEYSTGKEDENSRVVLERNFSENGTVTEESILTGIQRLNDKLDSAGMETFVETLKEQKHKSQW